MDRDEVETGPVDEVGYDVGRDEAGRGLLDTWAGRTVPADHERTGGGELTGSFSPDQVPLTAVLARVAAGLGRQAAADRFATSEGEPSRAVKALIADEPVDPLPVPEGLPLSGTGFLDSADGADITAVAGLDPVDPPDPAAATPSEPALAEAGRRESGLLLAAILVALAVGAVGAWLVLGG